MREIEKAGYRSPIYGKPIREQVDVKLHPIWPTCLPQLEKKLWWFF